MNPDRVNRRDSLKTLVLLTLVAAVSRSASAANPTMSECLSANEKAIDLRGEHKLRQARDQALVCAASSCPGEVRDTCQVRVRDLNAAIPTIVFEVKDASGNDLSAVVVAMDGQPFATRLDGNAVPIDPGDHLFSFAAEGRPTVEKHVVIYEGDKGRRERIQLGGTETALPPASTLPAAETTPVTPATTTPESQVATESPSSGLGTQKVIGLTLGGAGVIGVGVGSVLGAMTLSAWSSVKNACGAGGASRCSSSNPAAVTSDHDTARTDGTISTVAFVAGGAFVATGLVVFLTGGHRSPEGRPASAVAVAPSFGPGHAGVAFSGAF
jgi:hypothetical protein